MSDEKDSAKLQKKMGVGSKINVRILGQEQVLLDDIVGQPHIKEEVNKFLRIQKNPEMAKYFGIKMPNLLFHGSPGTGKTMMAKAIAYDLLNHALTIGVSSQDIGTAYINESANNLDMLLKTFVTVMDEIGYYKRGIVFFDEFDSIAKPRGGHNGHAEDDKVLNLLNSYMDGDRYIPNLSYIASTNFYDGIDAAQKSRFSSHLKFDDLKGEDVYRVIVANLKSREREVGHELYAPLDYVKISSEFKNSISGRDLSGIVNEALDLKMEYLVDNKIELISKDFLLTTEDLLKAINIYKQEHKTKKVIGL